MADLANFPSAGTSYKDWTEDRGKESLTPFGNNDSHICLGITSFTGQLISGPRAHALNPDDIFNSCSFELEPDNILSLDPLIYNFDGNNTTASYGLSEPFGAYLQTRPTHHNGFNMTMTNPASDIPSSSIIPEEAHSTYKCPIPDCPNDGDFQTKSSLEKHIEKKHTKPYHCNVLNCKHPQFGDKAGLDRHNREVHSSQSFPCPIVSCKRHTKPFHRRYNVFDHLKRCHPQTNRTRAVLLPTPTMVHRQGSKDRSRIVDEPASPESAISGEGVEVRTQSQLVRQRLDELRATRAVLDDDIQALERTVEIMENS
ncbi:hypothetical protein EG329_010012 [Mollisiaceae sp. DMI_Dod_QoI]|nr:hypothetical protein EG329_010012 [Helotiales sp. DMI_Dod_QoI]